MESDHLKICKNESNYACIRTIDQIGHKMTELCKMFERVTETFTEEGKLFLSINESSESTWEFDFKDKNPSGTSQGPYPEIFAKMGYLLLQNYENLRNVEKIREILIEEKRKLENVSNPNTKKLKVEELTK